ncbi:hypothetical protein G8759_00480 [Spirosoma aureum]|uniref:Uncharacterized protein n=1 Tax=Spirosoma aureum TaxID=2692134 RepID=A0A6G9AFH1_9BACT|nr:hypothetical protein [Spirosoma aureum]QIP11222.1 hypothetical protein G8759_00480 [Spirosoma aureum]
MMSKRVLLVGRNAAVLSTLADALTRKGLVVQTTNRVEQASEGFDAADFDLIAFGRGVDESTNVRLKTDFIRQNADILFVDGLAPIIPLLVRQISIALAAETSGESILAQFSYQQPEIRISVYAACQLKIDLYQLDVVHSTRQQTLISEFIEAGSHTFSTAIAVNNKSSINFLVAEVNTHELAMIAL